MGECVVWGKTLTIKMERNGIKEKWKKVLIMK